MESKIPNIRAKVITKDHGDQKDNKNAYVLLTTPEQAEEARSKLNQTKLGEKHLRVDIDLKDEKLQNDFETTIFIGNIPFITNEEDLRAHFGNYEGITNIRIVRDAKTFIGKGIAYIQFKDKEVMRKVIEEKNNKNFNGRPLRIKKAVEPRRLEKKKLRKEERAAGREKIKEEALILAAEAGALSAEEDEEINRLRNFEQSAYGDKPRKPKQSE